MTASTVSAAGLGASLLCAAVAGACVPNYEPPTAAQPHAIVKYRRVYEATAGTELREGLLVDEYQAYANSRPASQATTPANDAILLHPRPARLRADAVFSHQELRTVSESYMEQESYMDSESYSCGSGTSYRTCSRTVTRYRSVPHTRMVTKWVDVVDAECNESLALAPVRDGVYLLELTYQGRGACHLSCFEQKAAEGEKFQLAPCPLATAAQLGE